MRSSVIIKHGCRCVPFSSVRTVLAGPRPSRTNIIDLFPELIRKIMMEAETSSDMEGFEALRSSCSAMRNTIARLDYPEFQAEWIRNRPGRRGQALVDALLLCRQPGRVMDILIRKHGVDENEGKLVLGYNEVGVLQLACMGWHPASVEVIKLLISQRAVDINGTWASYGSPRRTLEWACSDRETLAATELLPKRPSHHCGGYIQRVPAVTIVKELLKHPAIDVNATAIYRYSALHTACRNGDVAVVSALLEHEGSNLNLRCPAGNATESSHGCLFEASTMGYLDVVSLLLLHPLLEVIQITDSIKFESRRDASSISSVSRSIKDLLEASLHAIKTTEEAKATSGQLVACPRADPHATEACLQQASRKGAKTFVPSSSSDDSSGDSDGLATPAQAPSKRGRLTS